MAKYHNHCVIQPKATVAVKRIHLRGSLFAFANFNNCSSICFLAIRQLLLKINSGKFWLCLVWKLSVVLCGALQWMNEATLFHAVVSLLLGIFSPSAGDCITSSIFFPPLFLLLALALNSCELPLSRVNSQSLKYTAM